MKRPTTLSRLEILIFTGLLILAAGAAISYQLSRPDPGHPPNEFAVAYGITHYFEDFEGLLHDDIEKDPRYLEVAASVDAQVQEYLDTHHTSHPFPAGQTRKQEILKKDHGIEWRTLGQMNPWIKMD